MTCTRRSCITLAALAVVTLAMLSAPSRVDAGPPSTCGEQRNSDDARSDRNYHTVIGADGTKTFVVDRPIVVCGTPPRPQVVYVLQQRSIEYKQALLRRNFLDRVLTSVHGELF